MSTIAEFRLPADDLALADAFGRLPELTVQFESSISRSVPSMWIAGAAANDVSAALAADDSVANAELLIETDDRLLYDVEPTPETRDRIDRLMNANATLLDATGQSSWWHLELRFPDRSALADTHDRFEEAGSTIEVVRVTQLQGRPGVHPRLTPEQREALVAAFEHGYFEIPRRTSMEELAEELGISHQALSERLRRAYETLVDAELQPAREQVH